MSIKTCPECGKQFTDKYNTRTFCSHQCANENHWHTRERAKTVEFTCKTCGKKFTCYKNDQRVKNNSVKYCCKQCSDEARKTGQIKQCPICGKDFYTTRHKYCSTECGHKHKIQNTIHKIYFENGYKIAYINGYNKKGNAKIHRLIMEKAIGRRLDQDEVVHHIDGNKTNNNIENLVIMSRKEHSRLHREQEKAQNKKFFTKR